MGAHLTLEEALSESHRRFNPSLRNPNWLVLRQRRRIFEERIKSLPSTGIAVLDVGGRLQPYRALIADRIKCYVAVDPQSTPLVNVAAVGEALPFRDGQFDLVISTQVLEYFPDPALAVEEFERVLKKGGIAFISAPAVALRDNEKEYWRFLPAGLRYLLRAFESIEVIAEGNSVTGLIRTLNVFLISFIRPRFLVPVCVWTVVPLLNLVGLALENDGGSGDHFAVNFSVWAKK